MNAAGTYSWCGASKLPALGSIIGGMFGLRRNFRSYKSSSDYLGLGAFFISGVEFYMCRILVGTLDGIRRGLSWARGGTWEAQFQIWTIPNSKWKFSRPADQVNTSSTFKHFIKPELKCQQIFMSISNFKPYEHEWEGARRFSKLLIVQKKIFFDAKLRFALLSYVNVEPKRNEAKPEKDGKSAKRSFDSRFFGFDASCFSPHFFSSPRLNIFGTGPSFRKISNVGTRSEDDSIRSAQPCSKLNSIWVCSWSGGNVAIRH